MNASKALRVLIIAVDHSLSNILISTLRAKKFTVSAASLNKPAEITRQITLKKPHLLILIQSREQELGESIKIIRSTEARVPLLIASIDKLPTAAIDEADSGMALPIKADASNLVCDVIPFEETERLLRAIEQQTILSYMAIHNRKLEKQLLTLEKQQLQLLDNNLNAIAILGKDCHLYCNPPYVKIFGCPSKQHVLNTPMVKLIDARSRPSLEQLLSKNKPENNNLIVRANTHNETLDLTFSRVLFNKEAYLQVTVIPAKGNDLYANEKQALAKQDLLTRLENIVPFKDKIESAIAQAIDNQIFSTLLIVHIDQFREVLETIGKSGTNQLLVEISHFLESAINTPFSASRLAENEFGLLLYNSDPDQTGKLAEYLQHKLNASHNFERSKTMALKASLGMVVINELALDAEDMINRARLNRATDFSSEPAIMNIPNEISNNSNTQQLPRLIRQALENKKITLNFQPLVPFLPDNFERYEVRMRLHTDGKGEILPADFLDQANVHNLAGELDKHLLEQLFEQYNLQLGKSLVLFIHISRNSLVSSSLLSWLGTSMQKFNIPSQQLVFQISEIDLHSNWKQATAFCQQLTELGIGKSITHFGSAMDPLSVLSAIKPDLVRLDSMLINRISESNQHYGNAEKLVRAIHHQKVSVCVTGIENLTLLPILWNLGADLIQGHCIHGPARELNFDFPREEKLCIANN